MNDELKGLLGVIRRSLDDPDNVELFQKAVSGALKLDVVDVLDMARGLRASLPMVNRWAMWQSAPHPFVRPSVYYV